MNKLSVFLALTFIAVFSANAQNANFIPHVSQIEVEARNNLIRLTWKDSQDAKGPVYIYRSARPFTGSIPANIRPVIVRYGTQFYTDDIDDMDNVYYFIAASDVTGMPYITIIPFVNNTNINISQPDIPNNTEAEILQGISNLRAGRDGNRVNITFDTSEPQKKAVLYRSTVPVRQPQDLLGAVLVETGNFTQFMDFPLPGTNWYYTVIFEDEISSGNVVIKPGINATAYAVNVNGERTADEFIRPIPLPFLTIAGEAHGGFLSDVSNEMPLSEMSTFMLNNTRLPNKLPMEIKIPRVYVIDLNAPTSGEDSALFQIVNEYFVIYDWESACINFRRYLSLPRSKDAEARARFYLGQALYYSGNYKDALWEFLSYKLFNPIEAAGWIEAVLTAMVY